MEHICSSPDCLLKMDANQDWFQESIFNRLLYCPACNSPLMSMKDYDRYQETVKRAEKFSQEDIDKAIHQFKKAEQISSQGILKEIFKYIRALYNMMVDPEAAISYKLYAAFAILYLVSPIDIIPDFIPFFGYVDDYFIIMTVVGLLGTALLKYMNDGKGEKKQGNAPNTPLIVIMNDRTSNGADSENYYWQDNNLRYWLATKDDLLKCNYRQIDNQVFRKNETYILHPILKNTLIRFENFNASIIEQKKQELRLLFSGLGLMEAEFTYYSERCNTTDAKLDISLLNEFAASGKANMSKGNHTLVYEQAKSKQDGNIDTSLVFIDKLLWLFEESANVDVDSICYKRIMNGEIEIEMSLLHQSEQYFSAQAKASSKKLCTTINCSINLSSSEAIKTVYKVKYCPLRLPESETKESLYERVKERIAKRISEINR